MYMSLKSIITNEHDICIRLYIAYIYVSLYVLKYKLVLWYYNAYVDSFNVLIGGYLRISFVAGR